MQHQNNKAIELAQYLGSKTGSMYKASGYSDLDPRLQAGLLGAGGGALVGGLGNALFGDDRKGFISRLLSGAVGGGAVGGLGGAGAQHFGVDLAGTGNEYFKRLLGPKAPVSPYGGSFMHAMQNKVNSGGEIGLGAGTTKDEDGSIVNDLTPPKPPTNLISKVNPNRVKRTEPSPSESKPIPRGKENPSGLRGSKTPTAKKKLPNFEDGDQGRTPSAE